MSSNKELRRRSTREFSGRNVASEEKPDSVCRSHSSTLHLFNQLTMLEILFPLVKRSLRTIDRSLLRCTVSQGVRHDGTARRYARSWSFGNVQTHISSRLIPARGSLFAGIRFVSRFHEAFKCPRSESLLPFFFFSFFLFLLRATGSPEYQPLC